MEDSSRQLRPVVYMDAELSFISDSDSPGASAYRSEIRSFCINLQCNLEVTKHLSPTLLVEVLPPLYRLRVAALYLRSVY
jgi:hypothetical protein